MEGSTGEALHGSERLLRVAPFDIFWRAERLGQIHFARQYQRVLGEVEQLSKLDPGFEDRDLGNAYLMLGRIEGAHRIFIAFEERCGAPCDSVREARERGWDAGGWEGSIRAWVGSATSSSGWSPVLIANAYTVIGEPNEALAWLERGHGQHDPLMLTLKAYPRFDPVRSAPRFQDLLRRIGFPEE